MGKEMNIGDNKVDIEDQQNSQNQQNGKKISKEDKEKLRKAQKRKNKKDKKKIKKRQESDIDEVEETYQKLKQKISGSESNDGSEMQSEDIEHVDEDEYILTGTYYDEFKDVFQYFKKPKHLINQNDGEDAGENGAGEAQNGVVNNDNETIDTDQTTGLGLGDSVDIEQQREKPLTKKQRKHQKRLKVAQLKALVKRPDLVEAWDITSSDPLFLVFLKSYKNTVQVPRHWCQKRKFLQNKRGILKPPFQLPEWIEATGISKLRDVFDRDGTKMVRQKLRERMNPKMGKIDIDYEILHDAFFKFQKKPVLTTHGDIYFEGKENEVKMKQLKPGKISEELRLALGITEFAPPPWIVNMQRYGPPPSYPNLKIPGLNSQLSEGQFYGKPSDDQSKHALTGNAVQGQEDQQHQKILWGEIVQEQVEEEEQEGDEEHDEDGEAYDMSEMSTKHDDKSGITSLISGLDTPEIDIRKQPTAMQKPPLAPSALDKPLYQVLEPIQKSVGNAFLGTTHGYIIPGTDQQKK